MNKELCIKVGKWNKSKGNLVQLVINSTYVIYTKHLTRVSYDVWLFPVSLKTKFFCNMFKKYVFIFSTIRLLHFSMKLMELSKEYR